MTSTFLSATALTFVISDTQKDVHVFVPETLDVCVVRTIAMTLRYVWRPICSIYYHC